MSDEQARLAAEIREHLNANYWPVEPIEAGSLPETLAAELIAAGWRKTELAELKAEHAELWRQFRNLARAAADQIAGDDYGDMRGLGARLEAEFPIEGMRLDISTLRFQLANRTKERDRLHRALTDALEGLEESVPYAPRDEYINRAREALGLDTEDQ